MVKVSEDSAAKFINALIKSVQTLCHGYLEFSNGIQIIGHINLSVDEGTSLDYILKEKVCKNAENSTLFISNSFHAEPKSEPEVSGKNPVNQRTPENQEESGRVGSAISSISSALTSSREKRKTGTKDSDNLHSHQNSGKRKASDDADHRPPKVTSHHDNSSASQSPYHSQSSPLETKEALRSKLRTASEMDMAESETLLPQTAGISGDSAADIGVNLAGSVLEPVDDQGGDLPGRDDDSDGDLEVTFIKEEFVEGERSACEYGNTGPFIGSHQRASEGMTDPSLYPVSLHSSSTYVPSAHDFQPGPSTSQSGSSSMRGLPQLHQSNPLPFTTSAQQELLPSVLAPHSHPQHVPFPSESLIGSQPSSSYDHLSNQASTRNVQSPFQSGSSGSLNSSGTQEGSAGQKRSQGRRESSGQSSKTLMCQFCDAYFASQSGLRLHINKVHFHYTKFTCEICSKGFNFKSHYEGHMNMHNKIKGFKCPSCPKRFTYQSGVDIHLRSESLSSYRPPVDKKPTNHYMPSTASASFSEQNQPSSLELHSQILPLLLQCGAEESRHLGGNSSLSEGQQETLRCKALVCHYCNASFASNSGLRGHINKVHCHFTPFTCDLCGKGFNFKCDYEGHMNSHNNLKAYKCKDCSCQFTYMTSLRHHVHGKHGWEPV